MRPSWVVISVWIACLACLFLGCGGDAPADNAPATKGPSGVMRPPAPSRRSPSPDDPAALPDVPLDIISRHPPNPASIPRMAELLTEPSPVRFRTSGSVRYGVTLDDPISAVSWSSHAGMSVSSGRHLYNITTRGDVRWKIILGSAHRVFQLEDQEIAWSSAFGNLLQLRRGGRVGWQRKWGLAPIEVPSVGVLLLDTSTVSLLASTGRDAWRASIDDTRELSAPFVCSDGLLLEAKRSQKRMAVLVSARGAVLRRIELPDNSVLLAATDDCDPILWSTQQIMSINAHQDILWQHRFETRPLFLHRQGYYLLVVPKMRHAIQLVQMNMNGTIQWKKSLPIFGRVADARVFGEDGDYQVLGLCKDVSSPCARKEHHQRAFNVVLTGRNGNFSVLQQVVNGTIGIATVHEHGVVIATSTDAFSTTLTFRDTDGVLGWETIVPGRLSAGPFCGPYGGVYVGTCTGWTCDKPYYFISLTAVQDVDDG